MPRLELPPPNSSGSGIGFGKTDLHNMELLDRVGVSGLGCAVMIGVSRKSFIGRIANVETPKARLLGTLAATAIALSRGVQIHRVHDVACSTSLCHLECAE